MEDDSGFGFWFWFKIIGGSVAACGAAILVYLVLGHIWYSWGLLGGFIVFAAALLTFGWIYDRRERKRRERLPA